jgi:hypothetical protein
VSTDRAHSTRPLCRRVAPAPALPGQTNDLLHLPYVDGHHAGTRHPLRANGGQALPPGRPGFFTGTLIDHQRNPPNPRHQRFSPPRPLRPSPSLLGPPTSKRLPAQLETGNGQLETDSWPFPPPSLYLPHTHPDLRGQARVCSGRKPQRSSATDNRKLKTGN